MVFHLPKDISAVLDVVLQHVLYHQGTTGGRGAHCEPMIVDLRDGFQPRKGKRQIEKFPAEDAKASGHLVLGNQRAKGNVLSGCGISHNLMPGISDHPGLPRNQRHIIQLRNKRGEFGGVPPIILVRQRHPLRFRGNSLNNPLEVTVKPQSFRESKDPKPAIVVELRPDKFGDFLVAPIGGDQADKIGVALILDRPELGTEKVPVRTVCGEGHHTE